VFSNIETELLMVSHYAYIVCIWFAGDTWHCI